MIPVYEETTGRSLGIDWKSIAGLPVTDPDVGASWRRGWEMRARPLNWPTCVSWFPASNQPGRAVSAYVYDDGRVANILQHATEFFDALMVGGTGSAHIIDADAAGWIFSWWSQATMNPDAERFIHGAWQSVAATAAIEDAQLDSTANDELSSHTRLASELRTLTGLSASALGTMLGVTREQYQRWIGGAPISDVRHGQLVYLHTVARDVYRRLNKQASVWWRTPTTGGRTPEDLATRRQYAELQRLVTNIPDRQPVEDGVLVGLIAQEPLAADELAEDHGEGWSPYTGDDDTSS